MDWERQRLIDRPQACRAAQQSRTEQCVLVGCRPPSQPPNGHATRLDFGMTRLTVTFLLPRRLKMLADEPSRAWAGLPGLQGRWARDSAMTNPSTPAEKPAVHACPYCAMPSVLSSCWCGFHLYPPALHMRGKGRLLQKRKGTQQFESQLAYAIFTLLHLHSGASATLAPKGSGGLD